MTCEGLHTKTGVCTIVGRRDTPEGLRDPHGPVRFNTSSSAPTGTTKVQAQSVHTHTMSNHSPPPTSLYILNSFPRHLSSHLSLSRLRCKLRGEGRDMRRDEPSQQTFNNVRHPCIGTVVLKQRQLNMTCGTAASLSYFTADYCLVIIVHHCILWSVSDSL